MAAFCVHCGATLPQPDAQICNACGMRIPSHLMNSGTSSSSAYVSKPSGPQPGKAHPPLREQIAQLSPSKQTRRIAHEEPGGSTASMPDTVKNNPEQTRRITSDEPPTWMSKLESQPRKRNTPDPSRPAQPDETRSIDANSSRPPITPATPLQAVQPDQTAIQKRPRQTGKPVSRERSSHVPQRDFPVPEPLVRPGPSVRELRVKVWEPEEEQSGTSLPSSMPPQAMHAPIQENELEDAPTRPLTVVPDMQRPSPSQKQQTAQQMRSETVTESDTVPLSIHPPGPTSLPVPQRKAKRRKPFLFVSILLTLLVIGVVVGWIVIAQPFTVANVTQPQQHVSNSSLSIALSYPTGWQSEVDPSKATLHLSDSSHTAQVNISASTPNNDINSLLSQEAKQLGMTALKPAPALSFAGASWQQLQGSVQQRGASYTETLFATIHNNRLYIFAQLAPQTIYSDEESLIFSGIRSSFQFL